MTCMSLLIVTPVPCCPLIRLCKNIYIYVTATFKHSLFCPFNFNFPPKICYKKYVRLSVKVTNKTKTKTCTYQVA